ncbi:hypothetical protein [Saccharopolyspora sp. ASAGF58]|uniref:hypothetical protein n=1 Tax=Saccharopolyspora sp. ASAGF58 TaxID=2719023 RepID=UPI001FF0847F|nr:hypothetical protein [Saccharopolyspora sp. ASAGF58]
MVDLRRCHGPGHHARRRRADGRAHPRGAKLAAPAAALGFVLALALTAGNIVVVNWSIDTIVGRARRFPAVAVAVWALTLAAFVAVVPGIPLPARASATR